MGVGTRYRDDGPVWRWERGARERAHVDEAAAAIEEVDGNWTRHAKAARELAVDRFDASAVVTSLMERVGVA